MITFTFDRYIPPEENELVVALMWKDDDQVHSIAEVSRSSSTGARTLSFWPLSGGGRNVVPFFDLLEAFSMANEQLQKRASGDQLSWSSAEGRRDEDAYGIPVEIDGAVIALVSQFAAPQVLLWGPDFSQAVSLPLFETLEALFQANLIFDRTASFAD